MRFLKGVTITGSDNLSDLRFCYNLSTSYPYLECGILFSPTKMGHAPRYPDLHTITSLSDLNLNYSAHICGRWAVDFVTGGKELVGFWMKHKLMNVFKRVQLNISNILESTLPDELLFSMRNPIFENVRFIIQVKDKLPEWSSQVDVDYLFDASGGKGIPTIAWPPASPCCGYAGGLTPVTLSDQLEAIYGQANNHLVWIDVESGVRTNNKLDAVKVEKFLEISKDFVQV